MTKKLTGLLAALALTVTGAAFAEGQQKKSAEYGQKSELQQHQLTGQIVSVERNTVYLEQQGAIVPLKFDEKTKFSQVKKDQLKEGQEIRATFMVKDLKDNVASEISLLSSGSPMEPEKGGSQE
ncbi:MAG: hypothetical protein ACYC8T_27805 [Myxococcaceae bacterium]